MTKSIEYLGCEKEGCTWRTTLSLEMQRNIKILIDIKLDEWFIGYRDHKYKERVNLSRGAAINSVKFAMVGEDISFIKSFAASARGWGSPVIDTLFGPLRSWI